MTAQSQRQFCALTQSRMWLGTPLVADGDDAGGGTRLGCMSDGNDGGWYWDLVRERVVRWDQRGPGEQVMGPYPTPEAARNWREMVERRNEAWEEEDEAWEEWGEDGEGHDETDG